MFNSVVVVGAAVAAASALEAQPWRDIGNVMGAYTALATLIVLMLAAVAAYAARTHNQRLEALTGQLGAMLSALATVWNVRGPGASARPTASSSSGAGRAASLTLPAWSQLNDPLPDGTQDPYATSDCGEECVAEVVKAVTGVTLSAGDIRYQLGGASRPGLTTAGDLAQALGMSGVPATAKNGSWEDAWTDIVGHVAVGRPILLLGVWLGGTALHWVVATSSANGILHFNDPWGGLRRKLSLVDAKTMYQGQYVTVDRAVQPQYIG